MAPKNKQNNNNKPISNSDDMNPRMKKTCNRDSSHQIKANTNTHAHAYQLHIHFFWAHTKTKTVLHRKLIHITVLRGKNCSFSKRWRFSFENSCKFVKQFKYWTENLGYSTKTLGKLANLLEMKTKFVSCLNGINECSVEKKTWWAGKLFSFCSVFGEQS